MRFIDADALRARAEKYDMQDTYLPAHFFMLIDEEPTAPVILRDNHYRLVESLKDDIQELEKRNKTQEQNFKLMMKIKAQDNCLHCKYCRMEIRCMHDDIEMEKSDLGYTGCSAFEYEE